MSWNPNTAIVLHQPIDFYALTAKYASESMDKAKVALEKIEKELCLYEPEAPLSWNGMKITVLVSGLPGGADTRNYKVTMNKIQKLNEIRSSFELIAKDLNVAMGFERTLALEIEPVNNQFTKLYIRCVCYSAKHKEILALQGRL
jgi:hypothetical protein